MHRASFIRTWALGVATRAYDSICELDDLSAEKVPKLADAAMAREVAFSKVDGLIGSMAQQKLGEYLVFCAPEGTTGTFTQSSLPDDSVIFRVKATAAEIERFRQEWRDALESATEWLCQSLMQTLEGDEFDDVFEDERDDESDKGEDDE